MKTMYIRLFKEDDEHVQMRPQETGVKMHVKKDECLSTKK